MLQACPSCSRHVFVAEGSCPFCSTRLTRATAPRVAAMVVTIAATMVGCGSPGIDPGSQTETGSAQGTSGEASTTAADGPDEHGHDVTDGGDAETTFGGETGTSDGADIETTSVGFIYGNTDTDGLPPFDCDLFAQECPEGEKCNAWANDGGPAWNSSRCVPVADDPDQVGETCEVEGSGVSGIDTCAFGAMCWDVDPATNVGECVALCQGDEVNPICAEGTTCVIANGGVIVLCLPSCDPTMNDCEDGQNCYPSQYGFVCQDWPGESVGYGDPCEFANSCDPGLACMPGESVPGCGSPGCCSDICDLGEPDSQCMGFADGAQCLPYYDDPPPGAEHVGACQLL